MSASLQQKLAARRVVVKSGLCAPVVLRSWLSCDQIFAGLWGDEQLL